MIERESLLIALDNFARKHHRDLINHGEAAAEAAVEEMADKILQTFRDLEDK